MRIDALVVTHKGVMGHDTMPLKLFGCVSVSKLFEANFSR
jgi:hypothetical protein